jgi:MFS family permease
VYRPDEKNFYALLAAQSISNFGNSLTEIGIAVFSLRITDGNALAFATVLALAMLPNVLLGWLATGVVDRWNRLSVLVGGDAARALMVVSIPLVHRLWWAYVIVFAINTVTLVYRPAHRAVVPELVAPSRLGRANALLETSSNGLGLAGYALASLLLLELGVAITFEVDALTFVVSLGLILAIRVPSEIWRPWHERHRSFRQSLAEGLDYYRRHPILIQVLVMTAVGAFGIYVIEVLAAIRLHQLHEPTAYYGFLMGAIAVGMMVGGMVIPRWDFSARPRRWICAGFSAMATMIWAFSVTRAWPVMVAEFVAIGFSNLTVLVPMRTWIQAYTPATMRGRVFSVRSIGIGIAAILSFEGGAWLSRVCSPPLVIFLSGAVTWLAAFYAWSLQWTTAPSAQPVCSHQNHCSHQ